MGSSTSGYSPALRMIELLTIPRDHGDVIVLLLYHPGQNVLGRYLPPSKINDLLLADGTRTRPAHSHDAYMMDTDEDIAEDLEFDIMDLATFLECAILLNVRNSLFHNI